MKYLLLSFTLTFLAFSFSQETILRGASIEETCANAQAPCFDNSFYGSAILESRQGEVIFPSISPSDIYWIPHDELKKLLKEKEVVEFEKLINSSEEFPEEEIFELLKPYQPNVQNISGGYLAKYPFVEIDLHDVQQVIYVSCEVFLKLKITSFECSPIDENLVLNIYGDDSENFKINEYNITFITGSGDEQIYYHGVGTISFYSY